MALISLASLYGLRWAVAALRTQRRLAPHAAAGDPQAQASVTQRPEAELLGIPNSAYGIVYYTALLALALSGRLDAAPWRGLARIATVLALARSVTLLVSLARTRTWCAVCMRGHAANALLTALLLRREARR